MKRCTVKYEPNDYVRKKMAETFGVSVEELTDDFIDKVRERIRKDPQFLASVHKLPQGVIVKILKNKERGIFLEKCKTWGKEILQEIQNKKEPTAS